MSCNSYLVVGSLNVKFKIVVSSVAAANYSAFYEDILWANAFTKLKSIDAVSLFNIVHSISLVEDVEVVALTAIECVITSATNESVVTIVAMEPVVAGVTIY